MANPILSRSETFTNANPYQGQAQFQQGQFQQGYDQYGQQYGQPQNLAPQQPAAGSMTMDDVITKSAISLGVVAITALLGLTFLPANLMLVAAIPAALAAMVVAWVVSSRRVVPAAGVLAFAALEGIFVGALSGYLEQMFPGIVATAVIATFATAGVTLAAYKFFNIRIGNKFRKILTIGAISIGLLYLTNLVLSFFNINLGVIQYGSGASGFAMLISAVAVVLAVMSLIADFDMIERGLANRAPATESWRAALGITSTMVWLYLEILRIASYFRN